MTKTADEPEELFHYTSVEGLLGIVRDRSIWASNIFYLNDTSELNYAFDLFREALQNTLPTSGLSADPPEMTGLLSSFAATELQPGSGSSRGVGVIGRSGLLGGGLASYALALAQNPSQELVLRMLDILDHDFVALAGDNLFVCSFSETGDLLSQWRGYCQNDAGYSIGFKFSSLAQIMTRALPGRLQKCIYNRPEQLLLVTGAIKRALGDLKSKPTPEEENSIVGKLFTEFLNLAPTLKHPQFSEEKEWRFVTRTKDQKFRAGKSMIVPFTEIRLTGKEGDFPLSKLVVGPTRDPSLAKNAVEKFLKASIGKTTCEILSSTIPYRN